MSISELTLTFSDEDHVTVCYNFANILTDGSFKSSMTVVNLDPSYSGGEE
jgi:hypothetical protein